MRYGAFARSLTRRSCAGANVGGSTLTAFRYGRESETTESSVTRMT